MDEGNPFQRILEAARRLAKRLRLRQSAIIGSPPSARHVPADAAKHAAEFARRYANEIDYHASIRMTQLGIPTDRIGATKYGYAHRSFFAKEVAATARKRGVSPGYR